MSSSPSLDPPRSSLPWPYAGWLGPVAYAYLGYAWWLVSIAQVRAAVIPGSGFSPAVAAGFALGSRLAGWLIECAYYWAWWRWRGRAFPYWRFFHWTAALSTVDLLADAIRHVPAASATAVVAKAWLVGPLAVGPGASTWAVAFGSGGIMTLLRLAMVARIQRQGLALKGWLPALLVAVTWATGRLVLVWSRDLLSGPSLH